MKKSKLVYVLPVLIVILIVIMVVYFIKNFKINEPNNNEIVTLSTIEGYDYKLRDRDTELFKSHFENLNDILGKEEIDYQEYAKELVSLYIIDLYTLDNKVNKYDVGGLDYVYTLGRDNYALNVEDTIYKYIENNSNGKRTQELPVVKEVTIDEISSLKVKIDGEDYQGYRLDVSWEYEKDLGYDENAKVEVAKIDDILYVTSESVLD